MKKALIVAMLLWAGEAAVAQLKELKPGWNLFSVQQDIQAGQEAKAQVEQQMPVVRDGHVTSYLTNLGHRLAHSPHAGNWPFSFEAIYDKNINAFALPGGPMFINTATIIAADNEAQLAGVMAHEMSHIVLRHGTHQASKAQMVQLPAVLAGAALGNGILGQLGRLGIGLGANSLLLKYSRDAESQADYNGAEIMADAGFNPVEMGRFFEKLEAEGGKQGGLAQFLSDHPSPGNRVKAVEQEIQYLPQKSYKEDLTGQFAATKAYVQRLPAPSKPTPTAIGSAPQPDAVRPSGRFKVAQGADWQMSYPDNWEIFGDQDQSVTIAPRAALVQSQNGSVSIGYGVIVSHYQPDANNVDLQRDTNALIQSLEHQDPALKPAGGQQAVRIDNTQAIVTRFTNESPFRGTREIDVLLTVPRPDGLFYAVFIAPEADAAQANTAFQQMMRSLRFAR